MDGIQPHGDGGKVADTTGRAVPPEKSVIGSNQSVAELFGNGTQQQWVGTCEIGSN